MNKANRDQAPLYNARIEYIANSEDMAIERNTTGYDIICILRGSIRVGSEPDVVEVDSCSMHILRRGVHNVKMLVDGLHAFEAVLITLDESDMFCRVSSASRADELFEDALLQGVSGRVSNEMLAEICCLSISTFKRRFRERYSASPHRWFLHLKLDIAERILRQVHPPMRDVATLCGFVNVSHFISTFRRRFRTTPSRHHLLYNAKK
jgi:AraC-like DNA-binding protein